MLPESSPPEPHPGSAVPALAARIREILRSPGLERESAAVPTGWDAVDRALGGGLVRGAVHEWFGVGEAESEGHPPGRRRPGGPWDPPLYLAIHLAWQAIECATRYTATREHGPENARASGDARVLWIGREVWPYPRALVRDFGVRASGSEASRPGTRHVEELELVHWPEARGVDPRQLMEHSLLVDAHPVEKRLWAVDAALRCSSVVAVVADGSRFDMAATRRLQLAAEVGRGLGLLFRPPWEARSLSAATTRWSVFRSLPRDGVARPRWSLELTRSKGQSVFGDRLL